MGVKEQVVLEVVCDVCKKDVPKGSRRKIGTLSVKTEGARGRASEYQVAFHVSCLDKLVDTASSGTGRKRKTTRRAKATRKR